jgi:putative solute:sodium symporter small subunit
LLGKKNAHRSKIFPCPAQNDDSDSSLGLQYARTTVARGEQAVMQLTTKHQEYWKKNLGVTVLLLGIWFVVTFIPSYFARELNEIVVLGFPLGFYMGAQGSLVIYVLIIWFYARHMDRLDKQYDVDEAEVE